MNLADGLAVVDTMDGDYMNFSQSFSCPDCGVSIDEIEPRSFSFNNPFGACPECLGLGYKMEFDPDLMIPDKSLSISEGAIVVMGWQSCTDKSSFTNAILNALCRNTVLIWIHLLKIIPRRYRILFYTAQADIL